MRLQTQRLILRPWQKSDLADYAALQGDPLVRHYYPAVMSAEQAETDLLGHMEKYAANGYGMMAAELSETGELVGLIGIGRVPDIIRDAIPSHPEMEIGWVIHHRFWGQGLAPEGAARWRDYAFEELSLPEIVAFTAAINTPSKRVMEKIGMRRDPADDYAHPRIAADNPLHPHVLYRIENPSRS